MACPCLPHSVRAATAAPTIGRAAIKARIMSRMWIYHSASDSALPTVLCPNPQFPRSAADALRFVERCSTINGSHSQRGPVRIQHLSPHGRHSLRRPSTGELTPFSTLYFLPRVFPSLYCVLPVTRWQKGYMIFIAICVWGKGGVVDPVN